jgi:O-acetylhomoserine/O-acetylserine sulfhydrylase-like pyridoxal-dependent enzyme
MRHGLVLAPGQGSTPFRASSFPETCKVSPQSLRLCSLAESLGGVESRIAHPATMTHASMTPGARAEAGIRRRRAAGAWASVFSWRTCVCK